MVAKSGKKKHHEMKKACISGKKKKRSVIATSYAYNHVSHQSSLRNNKIASTYRKKKGIPRKAVFNEKRTAF